MNSSPKTAYTLHYSRSALDALFGQIAVQFLTFAEIEPAIICTVSQRSEERRVGKECRYQWSRYQAEDGIRDLTVTGVQTCALPISFESKRVAGQSLVQVFGYEQLT